VGSGPGALGESSERQAFAAFAQREVPAGLVARPGEFALRQAGRGSYAGSCGAVFGYQTR
jgi:hypothetical protein